MYDLLSFPEIVFLLLLSGDLKIKFHFKLFSRTKIPLFAHISGEL